MMKIFPLLILFLLAMPPAWSEETDLRGQLKKAKRQMVIAVTDGDTVVLKDRSRVRLVGLQAPRLPLGRKNFTPWPLAQDSKKKLSDLLLHKFVTLYYGGQPQDRYGRALAHLFRDDGLWIQGEMLESGMARVYSFPDNRALMAEMMARERKARGKKEGIWALNFYQPKDQSLGLKHRNQFQLVHGVVRDVAKVRGTYYLNFGENWRDDFTIVIKPVAARLFHKAGQGPENYIAKNIEIRGWLKTYNGPMIEATHPEQITIIEERISHDPAQD